jgi:hypothetical protein
MAYISRMSLPDEKPLAGWKEIAKYLGRGIRTAQRMESKGLPVYRHPALGVTAFASEVEAWVKGEHHKPMGARDIVPTLSDGPAASPSSARPISVSVPWQKYLLLGAIGALTAFIVAAILANSYGLAILSLWVDAPFVVMRLWNTPLQRTFVSTYLIAAMAYTGSASTMPEFEATVINSRTLAPAVAFLFVLGLKFIPLFVLVLGYSVAFASGGLTSGWKKAYDFLAFAFLAVEILFLALTSGDDRAWEAGVPGRWTLLIASLIVLALNIAVWWVARQYFQKASPSQYRPLLLMCMTAYIGVAVAAFFVDHEQNLINRYFLDLRWPEAYAVAHPQAIDEWRRSGLGTLKTKIGPDLAALLNDARFVEDLQHGRFYKQHSDEPFQLTDRAVIYSYRPKSKLRSSSSAFVTIRFPQELAEALGFQPVGQ